MNSLKSLLLNSLILTLFAIGCSSSSNLKDFPKLSDAIRENYSKENIDKIESLNTKVPDLRSYYKFMAPGHRFKISHPSDSKLSGVFRINKKGQLYLPYNVIINANGKTFEDLKEEVLRAYSKFFEGGVEKVRFSLQSRKYYVKIRGLVQKPGTYLVNYSESLDEVISKAGGIVGDIVTDYFTADMQQRNKTYQVLLNKYYDSGKDSKKIYWTGYDSIFISKLDTPTNKNNTVSFVTLLGGVAKPGKVLYENNATLYYFLNKSGGTIPGLDYEESYVFRMTKEGIKKITFQFDDPSTIPVIFPNDIIYFNTQVETKTDKYLSRIVQIGSLISTVALLILAL